MQQAVRRTGLPGKIIVNFWYRRTGKHTYFRCVHCRMGGKVRRDHYDADTWHYIEMMLTHLEEKHA